jgi:FMN-dependent NADH-azoreductase
MSELLLLKASPRGAESITGALGESFAAKWLEANPDAIVNCRDLGPDKVAGPDQAWITANMTSPDARNEDQRRLLEQSDGFIEELHRATHIVVASPMYNFSMPWNLKAYVDNIVRVDKTFSFSPEAGFGPLVSGDKKLLLIWSGAGDYTPGTALAAFDFLTPYIRGVFAFLGVTNFSEIAAGNQFAPPDVAAAAVATSRKRLSLLSPAW